MNNKRPGHTSIKFHDARVKSVITAMELFGKGSGDLHHVRLECRKIQDPLAFEVKGSAIIMIKFQL